MDPKNKSNKGNKGNQPADSNDQAQTGEQSAQTGETGEAVAAKKPRSENIPKISDIATLRGAVSNFQQNTEATGRNVSLGGFASFSGLTSLPPATLALMSASIALAQATQVQRNLPTAAELFTLSSEYQKSASADAAAAAKIAKLNSVAEVFGHPPFNAATETFEQFQNRIMAINQR